MKALPLYLPDPAHRALRVAAAMRGISASALVRAALARDGLLPADPPAVPGRDNRRSLRKSDDE